ncbi:hypothetical protein BDN72DRAFT_732909, partial [Pluteus cervinus]
MSNRQRRWLDYMSKFNFDITYVKGEYNKVADCLSRYYESDSPGEHHSVHEYVNADRRMDPDGDDLPIHRVEEINNRVVELRAAEVQELRRMNEENIPTLGKSAISAGIQDMPRDHTDKDFRQQVVAGYSEDKVFAEVKSNPKEYPTFTVRKDGTIW